MHLRVNWNGWVRAWILFTLKYVIRKVLTESGRSENLQPKSGYIVISLLEFYDFKEMFYCGKKNSRHYSKQIKLLIVTQVWRFGLDSVGEIPVSPAKLAEKKIIL